MMEFVYYTTENIVGIGENAGIQHFLILIFSQGLQKASRVQRIHSSLLGKTWSGQVDYPSLSNFRTSAKWQADE